MTLCVREGKTDRIYVNYANICKHFRTFLSINVVQCLKGAWTLFLRSLSEDSLPATWSGSLMPSVKSVSSSVPCYNLGRRLKNPTGNLVSKTLSCCSTSWSAFWKQGNWVVLCLRLLMTWYVFFIHFSFVFSVLVIGILRPWPFLTPAWYDCFYYILSFPQGIYMKSMDPQTIFGLIKDMGE